jgi:hypothetical protein
LFSFVLLCAVASAVHRSFWDPTRTNYQLLLGVYLVALATATVTACSCRPGVRGFFLGYAAFGWAYLICVLHGGFGLQTIYDSEALVLNAKLGMALEFVAAVGTQLCISICGENRLEGSGDERHK